MPDRAAELKKKPKNRRKVEIECSFDPNRKCFDGLGDGSCYLKINTSERELAKVLTVFAFFRFKRIKASFEVIGDLDDKGKRGEKATKRAAKNIYH